jgi:predicted dehydrogenase
MTKTAVGIAVAGAGMIGRRHAAIIAATPYCTLSAIVDPAPAALISRPRLASRSSDHSVNCSRSRVRMASCSRRRTSSTSSRRSRALPPRAGARGKPLAATLEGGIALCEAAEAARVPILVGHHRRHSAIMAKAVEIVEHGTLGSIVGVAGRRCSTRRSPKAISTRRRGAGSLAAARS